MSGTVLSLDLGPTSIGWALLNEAKKKIIAAGVRVFPEGVARDKTGGEVPKNQARRVARGMRRQIARRARRRRHLRQALSEIGLLPKSAVLPREDAKRSEWESQEFQKANPYELRAKAIRERVELHELGRIFLQLAQRRGFLSNKKTDGSKEKKKETSEMLEKISGLHDEIQQSGLSTLGAFLAAKLASNPANRIRGQHTRRQMLLDEFDEIWTKQAEYYPDLLTDMLKFGEAGRLSYPLAPSPSGGGANRLLKQFGLHGLIFFQRKMYWPASVIGKCELDPKQKRCMRADRAAQEFRMLQEVNNLRIITEGGEVVEPTSKQREQLLALLAKKEAVEFNAIRREFGLTENNGFNLEAGKRTKLDGLQTDAKIGAKKALGRAWFELSDDIKNQVVRSLLHDEESLFREKAKQDWNFTDEQADKLLDVHLVEGYASYGLSTIERLLPFMRQGLPLSSREGKPCAIREAGFLLPWERPGKLKDQLPPPPPLTNPIVRQALFEVRKLVNAVVREYGKPDCIHIELARDVRGTSKQRKQATEQMREREDRRAKAAKEIEETGDKPTRSKIDRYLLWQEQSCVCMYSGKPINIQQLLGGEVDVDHILPYSKSLDDSLMNKVICFRSENFDKGQRTVYEWVAQTNPDKFESILQRAARLPIDVRNRKRPKFSQKTCELEQFISRQLTDTAYITSMVAEYVKLLGVDVLGSKGQLTAELRYLWGLNTILRDDGRNSKNREDHRHHAIDAIVIALTNRKRLQGLAHNRSGENMTPPWETFRDDTDRIVKSINVSHRASRKVAGALHEETIYGATQKQLNGSKDNRPWAKDWIEQDKVYVLRKALDALSLNEVAKIRDKRVQELVVQRLAEFGLRAGRRKGDSDDDEGEESAGGGNSIPKRVWEKPLILRSRDADLSDPGTVIKKVRLVKPEESIVPLGAESTRFVKPGNLHHVCLFETTEHNGKKKRHAVFVSMLDAIRRVRDRIPIIQCKHPTLPAARFIMSLSKGEMVRGQFKGEEMLVRFSTAASTQGQLYFVSHSDARPGSEVKKYATKANTLKAKKVHVDILGRIETAGD